MMSNVGVLSSLNQVHIYHETKIQNVSPGSPIQISKVLTCIYKLVDSIRLEQS